MMGPSTEKRALMLGPRFLGDTDPGYVKNPFNSISNSEGLREITHKHMTPRKMRNIYGFKVSLVSKLMGSSGYSQQRDSTHQAH